MNRYLEEAHLENETISNLDGGSDTLISQDIVWPLGVITPFFFMILSLILTGSVLLIYSKSKNKNCLTVFIGCLISLAAGSLFGDVVIHLLPGIFAPSEEHHDEHESEETTDHEEEAQEKSMLIVSTLIIVGFLVCFMAEKVFNWVGVEHSHEIDFNKINDDNKQNYENCNSKENQIHMHNQHHHENNPDGAHNHKEHMKKNTINHQTDRDILEVKEKNKIDVNIVDFEGQDNNKENCKDCLPCEKCLPCRCDNINPVENNVIPNETEKCKEKETNVDNKKAQLTCCQKFSLTNKKSVGVLSNLASLLHNTFDGLAIGIVFTSRVKSTIISTCLAIFLHELPKEISDAGVLLHSNFEILPVLFWNCINNASGILGAIIGLSLGSINDIKRDYTLSFVSGNFLYISLSQMIPIVLHLKGKLSNILSFVFLFVGLGFMYLIIAIEGDEHSH